MFTRTMGRLRRHTPRPVAMTVTGTTFAPLEGASACSEFLAPNDSDPDRWKVRLLHAKAVCWSLLSLGFLLLVLWAKKP